VDDAGTATSRARYVGSFGGEAFRRDDDVIRCPPLGLVRCNYVAMAPLPKICRNTQAVLGLK